MTKAEIAAIMDAARLLERTEAALGLGIVVNVLDNEQFEVMPPILEESDPVVVGVANLNQAIVKIICDFVESKDGHDAQYERVGLVMHAPCT